MFLDFKIINNSLNLAVKDSQFQETVENISHHDTVALIKSIIDVYRERNKLSPRNITRIYRKFYPTCLPRILGLYISEDASRIFPNIEDRNQFIPCAANYCHQIKKEIAFRGK